MPATTRRMAFFFFSGQSLANYLPVVSEAVGRMAADLPVVFSSQSFIT
jgi:hypothetical protein